MRRLGPCLAKVTWGENDKVSPERLRVRQATSRRRLPLFRVDLRHAVQFQALYRPEAVIRALEAAAGATAGAGDRIEEGPVETAPRAAPVTVGHGQRDAVAQNELSEKPDQS